VSFKPLLPVSMLLVMLAFQTNAWATLPQQIKRTMIQLDDRNQFNSRSLFVDVNKNPLVLFESISDYSFRNIAISVAHINNQTIHDDVEIATQMIPKSTRYNTLTGIISTLEHHQLYYTVSEGFKKPARLMRATINEHGELSHVTKISIDIPLLGMSFPRVHFSHGRYYLAFRKKQCCGLGFAVSNDGLKFTLKDTLSITGSMPAAESFSDNTLIYTYQSPYPTDIKTSKGKIKYVMKSRFKLSHDQGSHWSTDIPVSHSTFEIHDAIAFKRLDGNIDMYYSHDLNRKQAQLSLWRRCVLPNGKLGQEELVADERIGNIAKPNPFRVANGSIALQFIDQGTDNKQGSIQYSSIIKHDAVCNL